ncbi:MAG TPA: DUF3303 family protein [Limnochordales bacterium]
MSLFVVRHQHSSDRCPARDPRAGALLLAHLQPANAERHGLRIHGEAVVDGQHTLYMIVEADDAQRVESFMKPFAQAGSVEIWPASACERVVQRGGC